MVTSPVTLSFTVTVIVPLDPYVMLPATTLSVGFCSDTVNSVPAVAPVKFPSPL